MWPRHTCNTIWRQNTTRLISATRLNRIVSSCRLLSRCQRLFLSSYESYRVALTLTNRLLYMILHDSYVRHGTRYSTQQWYNLSHSHVSLICLTHMSHSYVSLICLDSAMIQLQLHYCWCIYTYIAVGWSGHGTVHPEVVGSIPAKTPKIENLNLHGFEIHRPSSKGTELLLQVPKAIINQSAN